ncbi:MAG: cytochrome c [Acidimicrobiia bacterium]|nr:cytochrome c [Acidimicrobiia bacterium]
MRWLVLVLSALVFATVGSAFATDEPAPGEDSGRDRLLAEGRVVYEANCMACHQTDGAGLSGVFPPLLDNPNVQDADYLRTVITMGREGELTVAGVTYDGAMPGFSALSEDQIESLILYVQEGIGAPVAVAPAEPAIPPPASTGLPFSTVLAAIAGFGVAGVALAAVAGPVAVAKRERGTFSTAQTWLKAIAIFVYFTVATVFIPSLVVESSLLATPPSVYEDVFSGDSWGLIRDLVGSGVWAGALLLGFWALRRGQREDIL